MRLHRVAADWLGYRPFWLDLAESGAKVCVVDVPMTFPALGVNAVEVVSWASHDQARAVLLQSTRDRARAAATILRRPDGSRDSGVQSRPQRSQAIRNRLIDSARKKAEAIRWLLRLEPWDLFIAIFGETHRGGHLLWAPDGDPAKAGPSEDLLAVYEAVDRGPRADLWMRVESMNSHLRHVRGSRHGAGHFPHGRSSLRHGSRQSISTTRKHRRLRRRLASEA